MYKKVIILWRKQGQKTLGEKKGIQGNIHNYLFKFEDNGFLCSIGHKIIFLNKTEILQYSYYL